MKINTLLVILMVLTPPALQAETTIDSINAILSTERIFSVAFILFLLFLGQKVWPWYTKQYEARQKMDYDYRMAQLASQERQEERQGDLLERIIKSNSEIKEVLAHIKAQIDICMVKIQEKK